MNKEEEIKKLIEEMTPNVILYVETLMEHYEKLEQENKQLKERIDKALDYIERRDLDWGSEEHEYLQSILKGDSNEIFEYNGKR